MELNPLGNSSLCRSPAPVLRSYSGSAVAGTDPLPPYRDSTLTSLLADAFGGNCKTNLIATEGHLREARKKIILIFSGYIYIKFYNIRFIKYYNIKFILKYFKRFPSVHWCMPE